MEQKEVINGILFPEQFKNDKLRFCRVRKNTKKPFEENWTNKLYTWQEIQNFLGNENYGVLCGHGDLAVIDSDHEALQLAVEHELPNTFKVKTGSGGTHNYFFIPNFKQKIILNLDDEKHTHLGEVQSYGTQVVGVGSVHPNGNYYEALNDLPIATLEVEKLLELMKHFMKQEIKQAQTQVMTEIRDYGINSDINLIPITRIMSISGFKRAKNGELFGTNPWHGSESGVNTWINESKNVAFCFRCNSGISTVKAIALNEGIISDCKSTVSKNQFYTILDIAKQKYGLQDRQEEAPYYTEVQKNFETPEPEINVVWSDKLKDYQMEEKGWIIEKLLPMKSSCILTGKRGTMKTFISLLMAYSIATGRDFLSMYQAEQGKVLYLDKENGLEIMKQRCAQIEKGLNFKDVTDIGFICFSQLKVDRFGDITALEKLIEEHKPKLLIIDTYRRAVSFDENDAGEVSKLFVDTLRPMIEKYNLSILLIHHDKKGNGNGKHEEDQDEMDQMRGSSDLANYADIILSLRREGKSLILKQLKNRNAQEEKPIKICAEFNEEGNFCKFDYDGEFIKRTTAEKCAEIILLWFNERKIKHFARKELVEYAKAKGFKETNIRLAINELLDRGLIERADKGEYDVRVN